MSPDVEYLKRMQIELTKKGKLIEAGWTHMRVMSIPLDAPAVQVEAMRTAYYMGAHHLFTLLEQSTENDGPRIDAIGAEMTEFMRDFSLRYIPPGGSG